MRLVEISLTDRCQCRCGHCFATIQQPLSEKDEFSTEEIKTLIDDLSQRGIITVAPKELIYSGELDEIARIGQKMGVTVVRINFPVPIDRLANQDNQTVDLEEREKVRELLRYGNVVMESPAEEL